MPPTNYQIVVDGELGGRYASAFEGMTISAPDGITEITGAITDSGHLQGLLERIVGLGLMLHSVTSLDTANGESAAYTPEDKIRATVTNDETQSEPLTLTAIPTRSLTAVSVGRRRSRWPALI